MSLIVARKKRSALYLSIAGLVVMAAAVMAISARDPDGAPFRVGMVVVTVGAAMFLPWYQLVPAVILIWFLPDATRSLLSGKALFNFNMLLELPGLMGLAAFGTFVRESLGQLEREMLMVGADLDSTSGLDPKSGVLQEARLLPDLSAELARSRRFGRSFAFVLAGIDDMRQRFDYRDEESWDSSLKATAELLRGTRNNVDRVYQVGTSGYALLLPESGEKDVKGLVRRLRRTAHKAKPSEGQAGGPFALHYGATFYPACATSTDDLMRRAEIAMRIAEKSPDHLKIDTAAAPEMAPVESLRRRYDAEDTDAEGPSEAEVQLKLEPQGRKLHVLSAADNDALEGSNEPTGETGASVEPAAIDGAEPELAPVIAFGARSVAEEATQPPETTATEALQAEPDVAEAAEPVVPGQSVTNAEPVSASVTAADTSEGQAPETEAELGPASFDDDIAGLLAHLDETLEMIRTMKSTAA
ncbi:MAG TPA: diguanylate cyclase [Dehalococcoidia bacterium]|nr:diguanylate cyclase [Dehalococcoidia bacterium]